MRSSNRAPGHLLRWVENLCPHEKPHMNVYSSFIHNGRKLEATKIFFLNKWMDKQMGTSIQYKSPNKQAILLAVRVLQIKVVY